MDALGSRGNREQLTLELNSYVVACRFFTWNDRWRGWNVVSSGVILKRRCDATATF
jgi:hypothetical protein